MTARAMLPILAALSLAAGLAAAPASAALELGREAPAFDLRTIDADRGVSSGELFASQRHVFLVFWSAGCPHCVEALRGAEAFHRRYGGQDVSVTGIAADEGDLLAVRRIVEAHGITFAQLHDAGGFVSAAYGVPFETLVIVHVAGGAVAGAETDPADEVDGLMERMLLGDTIAAPETTPPGGEARAAAAGIAGRWTVRGWSRIRALAIDSRGESAAGIYGETVRPGGRVDYRAEIEPALRVSRHLRAGALLRISNEGSEVLDSGPTYLGSPWGSAFAALEAGRFSLRLGYYAIEMTPLTLMRWDWNDNPRIGGNAGCGCGAAAGVLLVESLDDLGPELTFEGALAGYALPGGELRAFYAVPRRPRDTPRTAWITGADDRARYGLELYGAEWRWRRAVPRVRSEFALGARYVGSREDRHGVDFAALGYPAADPRWESGIASVSAEAAFAEFVRARAEGVVWNRATQYGRGVAGDTIAYRGEGRAVVAGLLFEGWGEASLAIDYLALDPEFYSPFAALSYEPDREGYRAAAHASLGRARLDGDLFFKRVRERTPPAGAERAEIETAGVAMTADIGRGFGATAGWIREIEERGGAALPYRSERRAFEAGLQLSVDKSGMIEMRYDRVRNEEGPSAAAAGTTVDLYAFYTTIRF